MTVYNLFLSHKKGGKSVFELGFPKPMNFLSKDYILCQNGVFKWDDIEVPFIEERANFTKELISIIEDPKTKLIFMNTLPLEEIFPLKFIDLITDSPDYTFGQPIYNQSLNFYTYLLDFFCKFYLEKDFQILDKIEAEDIETYSPIARIRVRRKNLQNQFIRDKYFNKDFNLQKFAVKLVEKFVVGATWRWIGGNHKAHIYSIKICKMLMEYGLLEDLECEEIKNILYLKIQIYKSLETIIDKDSKTIADTWVKIWRDGMTQIREYYCEILIHYLYYKQDNEVALKMTQIYQELGENQSAYTKSKLDNLISFSKSILFEPEFSRKMMDFLLGYILSQNTIKKEYLTSRKIESVAVYFLHIFSNVDDPYLHSLKLLNEQDYLSFVKMELGIIKPEEELIKDVNIYMINLRKTINSFNRGKYYSQEAILFTEVSVLLDKINEKLNFMQAIDEKAPKDYIKQYIIFNSNFPIILLNFFGELIQYYIVDIRKFEENNNLLMKFSNFLQFYLCDNIDNHSVFLMKFNVLIFENMFNRIPSETIELLYEIFSRNSLILLVKKYILDILLTIFPKQYKTILESPSIDNYGIFSRIIDVIALVISFKSSKITEWISEYDIRISINLISETYKDLFNTDDYEVLLQAYSNNKNSLDGMKLACYMNFLSLITVTTAFRYNNACYKYVNSTFTIDKLNKLIDKCGSNLEFRTILMDLYSNFHVDFKNHLLNDRSDYYFSKPADMQYEEDPFYDKEYEKTIDLLIRELNYVNDLSKSKDKIEKLSNINDETFINYLNSTILGTMIKLMNYFLVIKEGDLGKLSKYIPKLEELKTFLYGNTETILVLYGIDMHEIHSPERKKHDLELANIDPEMKIKIEKKKIIGNCTIILEACGHLVKHKPLLKNKQKLMHAKSSVNRIHKTQVIIQGFSNKLAERRGNVHLPFEKADKRKEKAGGRNEVVSYLAAHYEYNKLVKTSTELEKNIYIYLLKDEKNPEMMAYSYNLCSFIHNQICKEWLIDKKNDKFTLIETLIHSLFISTKSVQMNLFKVIQESGGDDMLDMVWTEMKGQMTFVKFKTNMDKYWKESFKRCMILIKFHQYLCEDNNSDFKEYMRVKILPNDTIDRVQRWTTIFQRMSDNCNWHYNYVKGEISDFDRSHRPYLFPLATVCFDNLAELCTGPCFENQQKVYTYIYDRYNGFLKRFWRDPNTEYYRAKLSLIEFLGCMAEGNDPNVLNYQMTNLELNNLFTIIVDSLRQLLYCIVRNDPFDKKKLSDYPLYMRDYDEIQKAFQMNLTFSKHILLQICLKLFAYIRTFSEFKSKYEIFCNERDDQIRFYERNNRISNPSVKEDELVTYKFLSRILVKIEIIRTEDERLIPFYFPISSKCYYLSDISKKKFLKDVDRTSIDSKLSGLYSENVYFNEEMIINQERYNNRLSVYKYFGSGNYTYLEIFTLILAFANNILLVQENTSLLYLLGALEIFGSVIGVLLFLYFSYPLQRKIKNMRFLANNVFAEDEVVFFKKLYIDIFESFFFQKFVWVFLYHIICVGLGFKISYAFLTFDLMSTINLVDTMQFILRSVTEHIGQLISTLLLSALLMFSFAMLVDLYFLDNVDSTECSNFVNCYFYIMEQAFTNGQGLAGITDTATDETNGQFYSLFFLNITFFILVNTVLLNIVLAILVDTFSGLRQKAEFFEKDNQTICFICGIEKYNFEKSKIDFEIHVREEHNVWSYVNFLIFMSEKSEKDCNGVESEIYEKIKFGSLDWFPKKRSISLGLIFIKIKLIFIF